MDHPPLLTTDLAWRIERFSAPGEPDGTAAGGVEVRRFGAVVARKAPNAPWRNGVFCFGRDDVGRLGDVLAWFAADGIDPPFHLGPARFDATVAAALTDRGYGQAAFTQAILYGTPAALLAPAAEGVTVERVTPATYEAFAAVTAGGFGWPDAWRAAAVRGLIEDVSAADAPLAFLARYGGEPAGAATLTVRDSVAGLGGGAVLSAFRARGCHLALVRHRVAIAAELGCELIVGGADYGSSSFRNQYRVGLRLAYVEATWRKRQAK
ncbi:MAG TPA: GNAT family N-acetyltransferase [Tepidisphaeraceae bacterium]|nr:GNAT family N-acetyltransferase [Tepidisphaeraceae bacterium]